MEEADDGLRRPWSGKQLEGLLKSLSRAIEIVMETKEGDLVTTKVKPDSKKCLVKELKAHLLVGINNVTRALERMHVNPVISDREPQPKRLKLVDNAVAELEMMVQKGQVEKLNVTPLQAVIVAIDVHPRVLVSHLVSLCASRGVPMLPVSGGGDGCGSLRLGELLGTRTAIAIGIKAGDTPINWAVEVILETKTK